MKRFDYSEFDKKLTNIIRSIEEAIEFLHTDIGGGIAASLGEARLFDDTHDVLHKTSAFYKDLKNDFSEKATQHTTGAKESKDLDVVLTEMVEEIRRAMNNNQQFWNNN